MVASRGLGHHAGRQVLPDLFARRHQVFDFFAGWLFVAWVVNVSVLIGSGLGLTIGSIASTVRNITFRDCYMKNT